METQYLTFEFSHPPAKLKVCSGNRPYFKNPQRRFCCQKYGHSRRGCRILKLVADEASLVTVTKPLQMTSTVLTVRLSTLPVPFAVKYRYLEEKS